TFTQSCFSFFKLGDIKINPGNIQRPAIDITNGVSTCLGPDIVATFGTNSIAYVERITRSQVFARCFTHILNIVWMHEIEQLTSIVNRFFIVAVKTKLLPKSTRPIDAVSFKIPFPKPVAAAVKNALKTCNRLTKNINVIAVIQTFAKTEGFGHGRSTVRCATKELKDRAEV